MSLEYIAKYYNVPAEIGRRVEIESHGDTPTRQGVIVGAKNQYLRIHLDGDKKPIGVYHPTWKITYLDMGKVPKLTRSQQRYARFQSLRDCFDSFSQFLAFEKDERKAASLGFSNVHDYYDWLRTI